MNGITMNAMPSGLLAKKGAAKPAMRRQSQVQQAGFGSGSMTGLSGWLTGAEDDCGWNDMGDTPAHAPGGHGGGSVIGLTPVSDKPDSLYLHSNGDDWDEAEGYDEDQRAEPGWTPSPVAAANPVGAMQDRLREAAAPQAPSYGNAAARNYEQPSFARPEPVAAEPEAPIGLFGHVRAMFAHMFAIIFGRGPVLVVHPDGRLRDKIADAAAREGCSEAEIAERAIARYVDAAPKSGFTTSHVMGNA